jgi:hypothetical protein
LKHRSITGEEVSSQIPATSSDENSSDDEVLAEGHGNEEVGPLYGYLP